MTSDIPPLEERVRSEHSPLVQTVMVKINAYEREREERRSAFVRGWCYGFIMGSAICAIIKDFDEFSRGEAALAVTLFSAIVYGGYHAYKKI